MPQPVVSVVIVEDYAPGTAGAWDDFRRCLTALASQDFDESFELILSEWDGFRDSVPADLDQIALGLKVVFSSGRSAFELRNEGVRVASAPLVALLDADCMPAPGWLRAAVEALRSQPSAAAVSGRTLGARRTWLERISSLPQRAVGDEGSARETCHLLVNNAAYRRQVYLRHPLSLAAGICGHRLQTEAIRRAGGRIYFEPGMEAVHVPLHWAREREVRRLMGLSIIKTRLVDPLQPYAWLVRLRYLSIPIFVVAKTLLTARRCWLRRKHFAVRWYEVPVAVAAGFVRHLLETPGMVMAFRGQSAPESAHR